MSLKAIPAMATAVIIAFASAAWAHDNDSEVKVKTKTETTSTDHEHNWFGNLWHRGDWTKKQRQDEGVTVRTYKYREPEAKYRESEARSTTAYSHERAFGYREPGAVTFYTYGRRGPVYTNGYREPAYTYGYAEPESQTVERRRVEVGGPGTQTATRQISGPYRYFFTDAQGKYNYYLDRYGYPYQYGGREVNPPVSVLGYVPPERIGGGPPMYFREERPLSRSIFDGPSLR